MQSALKRQVGYSALGPRGVQRRRGDRIARNTSDVGALSEGNVIAVLRLVEILLESNVNVSVRPFPTEMATAMSPSMLADSLAALVRGVASNDMSDRNIRISVMRCELENGAASAAGVLPGSYVVFEIENDRESSRGPIAGRHPLNPGVGLAAARDAVVDAGGSVGLSRAPTGGARFAAYVPARPW